MIIDGLAHKHTCRMAMRARKKHSVSSEIFVLEKNVQISRIIRLWCSKPYETGLEVFTLFATSFSKNPDVMWQQMFKAISSNRPNV